MSDQHPYGYFIEMVEHHYFRNVDRRDLDAVLDCFTEDATFTIQSAWSTHEGRDDGIRKMFEDLFHNYPETMLHRHFRHVVDPQHDRISSQFTVDLVDREGERLELSNCNFFYFREGKISEVFVYMSDGKNVLN